MLNASETMTDEQRAEEAKRAERVQDECVEQVFGLTGGELDNPWETSEGTFPYNYEGPPEYTCDSPEDFPEDAGDVSYLYRTIVAPDAHDLPDHLSDGPPACYATGLWERVATFSSSGECECVYSGYGPGDDAPETMTDRPCPYCEAQEGEEHGHIYLGDGWGEAVYRHAYRCCETCNADIPVVGPCLCPDCGTETDGSEPCVSCGAKAFPISRADGSEAFECDRCGHETLID